MVVVLRLERDMGLAWWWGVVADSAPFAARFAAQSRPVVGTADWGGVVFVGLVMVWVGKP